MKVGRAGFHLVLASLSVFVAAGCLRWIGVETPARALAIGLGYLSLTLVATTLILGPLALWTRRRNPVNIFRRRDVGIWAGLTGLAHVWFGFQVHLGGNILHYFVQPIEHQAYFAVGNEERYYTVSLGYLPQLGEFGIANWTGLAGTATLLLLLLLSNDLSLRALRGPRWKALQRLNYVLAVLVLIHTFLYQIAVDRGAPFGVVVMVCAVAVIAIQLAGVVRYRLGAV
ncbi:MAG: hypothetical protein U0556_04260 [Dehalococcoidia bacterium]